MRLIDLPRESSFDKTMRVDTSFSAKPVDCVDSAVDASPALEPHNQTADDATSSHECATYGELRDALAVGIPASRILFTDPNKSPASLRFASRLGVDRVTVDHLEDCSKVKAHFPTARIVVRVNAGCLPDHLSADSKLTIAIGVACDLLEEAASLKLHVIAMRLHVGTYLRLSHQCRDPES